MSLFNYFRDLFYSPFRTLKRFFNCFDFRRYYSGFTEPRELMTEEDKANFKKTLGSYLNSNFDIHYKSDGVLLSRKENSGLVARLA